MSFNVNTFDSDDFAYILSHSEVGHSISSASGTVTHIAKYLGRNAILIEQPGNMGGTVIEPTQPGEVGIHELVWDALKHRLIDLPSPHSYMGRSYSLPAEQRQ